MATWGSVATTVANLLVTDSVVTASATQYPVNDIASSKLPFAVVRNPRTSVQRASVRELVYDVTFNIDILVSAIPAERGHLTGDEEAACWLLLPLVAQSINANRTLSDVVQFIEIAPDASIARFTPATSKNGGVFAGLSVECRTVFSYA